MANQRCCQEEVGRVSRFVYGWFVGYFLALMKLQEHAADWR